MGTANGPASPGEVCITAGSISQEGGLGLHEKGAVVYIGGLCAGADDRLCGRLVSKALPQQM